MNKVMIKRVGKKPEIFEVKEVTLEYMQEVVGGLIEMPYLSYALNSKRIDIVINEEGKLEGLDVNMLLLGDGIEVLDILVGDILFVANDGEGRTIGLNDNQIKYLDELFDTNRVVTNHGVYHYITNGGD